MLLTNTSLLSHLCPVKFFKLKNPNTMKTQLPIKFFTLILVSLGMFFITAAKAQSPITLNYKNFLVPPAVNVTYHYTEGDIPVPAEGENQIYNYGYQPDVNAFDYNNTWVARNDINFLTPTTANF